MRPTFALALLLATLSSTALARPVVFSADAPAGGSIVLPLASAADLETRASALDPATRAAVARALAAAAFDYKARSTLALRGIGPWTQVLVIGTGAEALGASDLQDIGGLASKGTGQDDGPVTVMATGLAPTFADAAVQLGVGAGLGRYSFERYKSAGDEPRKAIPNQPLTIVTADPAAARRDYEGAGAALVESVNWTRDLVSEPSNVKHPEWFVAQTREAFRGVSGVTIEALDVPAMERLKMGAILGVGQGSRRPPRMLVVHYKGAGGAPIVLAGKGITFDSGGTSIKPSTGMWKMKGDMSGAAAVVGAVRSLAVSRAPVNVVAIAALAENMPGGGAIRPGDVLTTHNGKTIEINSTDAEGRLVLADAVAYADSRFKPAAIVDVATLTGAVVGALGDEYAGLFSRHDALADQLTAAGAATGDTLWRLPLHPSYAEDTKSDIADIRNGTDGGSPGAGHGAQIIGYFVNRATPWAHLDIAGVAWADKPTPTAPTWATGAPVRLLDRFVRDWRPVPRAVGEGGY